MIVFGRLEKGITLHQTKHRIIVSIGVFKMNKPRSDQRILVIIHIADSTFKMHLLIVCHYILQMIPAKFNTEVFLIVKKISHTQYILRYRKRSTYQFMNI